MHTVLNNTLYKQASQKQSGSALAAQVKAAGERFDIIVFSHIRWGSLYQRPHHIMMRMAANNRILFIEEPLPSDIEYCYPTAKITEVRHNITVMQPLVNRIQDIQDILVDYLNEPFAPVAWFYSASFTPLLNTLCFGKVVYDCIEEPLYKHGAAPELAMQEQYLLSESDIVFTGGKSLFESKYRVHDNVYCFPPSVERKHFEKTRTENIEIPADIAAISGPVAGFHGIISNHTDLELLRETAVLCPGISFVLIGPLADTGVEIPELPNIHYLGDKSYHELPYYLHAFDIAILPLAVNEATRFSGQVNILEYMAADKPIIATPVHDLVRDYKNYIYLADNAADFSRLIHDILSREPGQMYSARHYNDMLDSTSWDFTTRRMSQLIVECSPVR